MSNIVLSCGVRVSIKKAIRYQTGINSGDVVDYYYRHSNVKVMTREKLIHTKYMDLGFTPEDLIILSKSLN